MAAIIHGSGKSEQMITIEGEKSNYKIDLRPLDNEITLWRLDRYTKTFPDFLKDGFYSHSIYMFKNNLTIAFDVQRTKLWVENKKGLGQLFKLDELMNISGSLSPGNCKLKLNSIDSNGNFSVLWHYESSSSSNKNFVIMYFDLNDNNEYEYNSEKKLACTLNRQLAAISDYDWHYNTDVIDFYYLETIKSFFFTLKYETSSKTQYFVYGVNKKRNNEAIPIRHTCFQPSEEQIFSCVTSASTIKYYSYVNGALKYRTFNTSGWDETLDQTSEVLLSEKDYSLTLPESIFGTKPITDVKYYPQEDEIVYYSQIKGCYCGIRALNNSDFYGLNLKGDSAEKVILNPQIKQELIDFYSSLTLVNDTDEDITTISLPIIKLNSLQKNKIVNLINYTNIAHLQIGQLGWYHYDDIYRSIQIEYIKITQNTVFISLLCGDGGDTLPTYCWTEVERLDAQSVIDDGAPEGICFQKIY